MSKAATNEPKTTTAPDVRPKLEVDSGTIPTKVPGLYAITGDQCWFYALLVELRELNERVAELTEHLKGKQVDG